MTMALIAVMIAQLRRRQVTEAMASISGTFFGVFYVGWLLSHVIPLRFFTERIVEDAMPTVGANPIGTPKASVVIKPVSD